MSDIDFERLLRMVMERRDKGLPFKDFLDEVNKEFWPEGDGPQNADQFSKLAATAAHSSRCPAWYKTWFEKAKTRTGAAKSVEFKVTKPVKKANMKKAKKAKSLKVKTTRKPRMKASKLARAKPDVKKVPRNSGMDPRLPGRAMPKMDAYRLEILVRLREVFASCAKLIDIGAMDASQAFRIALEYLNRV
jgi:hypothetical protein